MINVASFLFTVHHEEAMGHWEDQGKEPGDAPCHLWNPVPELLHCHRGIIIFIRICSGTACAIETRGATVI